MMDNKNLNPELIQILDFKLIKGQIESPLEFDEKVVKGHSFNADFEMGFNIEDKLAKTDIKFDIRTESNKKQEEAVGHFYFAFIYNIENLGELIEVDKQKSNLVNVAPALSNALASITYSTSRGILMTRFQGTALRGFILPVIDPNSLTK
ncbi:MAG: hypothetical protein KDC83_02295 [Flavobacteriales bacterium]|nr:hypothetical protein [Flavobacteriales bacterium]